MNSRKFRCQACVICAAWPWQALVVAVLITATPSAWADDAGVDAEYTRATPLEFSLAGDISLFGALAPHKSVIGLDLNVGYSHLENLYGITAGVAAGVDRNAYGIQASAILNVVDRDAGLLQVAGLYNRVNGDFGGLQVTAGKNVLKGPGATALQFAGFKNETIGNFTGMQWALGFNDTSGMLFAGAQGSLLGNWSEAELFYGFQESFLFNGVWGSIVGVQLAAVNYVGESARPHDSFMPQEATLKGCQIGIVNIGGWIRGAQIGVINVADALTGVQIGGLNFSGNGGLRFFPGINIGAADARKP